MRKNQSNKIIIQPQIINTKKEICELINMETNQRKRSERNQELECEREVPLTVETKKGNIVNLIGCHTTPNLHRLSRCKFEIYIEEGE